MQYSDAYLREVLPPQDPPSEFVPAEVEAEVRSRRETSRAADPDLIARSARWTYAMFNELRLRQVVIDRDPVWFSVLYGSTEVTIGLYDKATEQKGFGLALVVNLEKRAAFEAIGQVNFPRLKRQFPLAIRRASSDEHAPPHPKSATSTAWAQFNTSSERGILTAGHNVRGSRRGQSVTFANGQIGTLRRTAYPVIDAAFVTVSGMPSIATPIAIVRFPAAGDPAIVELQSGAAARTVVGPADNLGTNNIREMRLRFYTDLPCSPGDSGALVRSPQGEAMGIYTGPLTTSIVPSGLAGSNQNFEQAVLALDVTAYQ